MVTPSDIALRSLQGPLRNYDTKPASIATPLVYIPDYLMNTPAGLGRTFTFPSANSTAYVAALEELYYSVSQAALGYQFCDSGYPLPPLNGFRWQCLGFFKGRGPGRDFMGDWRPSDEQSLARTNNFNGVCPLDAGKSFKRTLLE